MRYAVALTSGHRCCFDAAVIDTEGKKDILGDAPTICECFDEAAAQLIARALNELTQQGEPSA